MCASDSAFRDFRNTTNFKLAVFDFSRGSFRRVVLQCMPHALLPSRATTLLIVYNDAVSDGDLYTTLVLDMDEVRRVLEAAGSERELSRRIDRISEGFLGRPYAEGLLGGGPDLPEEFRIDLTAFDCVTYMETVLALALVLKSEEFVDTIRRIRYQDGKVDWVHRNHYMIDWLRNNEQDGFVKGISAGHLTVEKTCTLSIINGLPARTTTFPYFPAAALPDVAGNIETGDFVLFVSTRETLDVFHTGLLVFSNQKLLLRHATRTAGALIEQELVEFMRQNTMAGFMLLRPICRR